MELANRVFVFTPDGSFGIMFYDQSPRGAEAKLAGDLPEGVFWSSGEEQVSWDEKINGHLGEGFPADNETSLVVNNTVIKYIGGSCGATTIIVSFENFLDLLRQINDPKYSSGRGKYKVLNLNSKLKKYTPNIDSVFSELEGKELNYYNDVNFNKDTMNNSENYTYEENNDDFKNLVDINNYYNKKGKR